MRRVWMPAAALFLSASTAVLLFPFFTYVPHGGRMNAMLPQVPALTAHSIAAWLQTSGKHVLRVIRAQPWSLSWGCILWTETTAVTTHGGRSSTTLVIASMIGRFVLGWIICALRQQRRAVC